MSKKLLGLGFVFSAIDKGVRSFLRETSNMFSKLTDSMDKTTKAAGKDGKSGLSKAMGGVTEGLKLMGIGKIARGISGIAQKMTAMEGGTAGAFKQLELMLAETRWTKGQKAADTLLKTIINTSKATSASVDDLSAAAKVMLDQGMDAKDIEKRMERIGFLHGVIGINAEDNAKAMMDWKARTKGTVQEFDDLQNRMFLMQKRLGTTGLGKLFPSLIKDATDWAQTVGQDPKKMLKGVMALTGAFKSVGLSQEDTTEAVSVFSKTMVDNQQQMQKIRAGLEGSLDGYEGLSIVVGSVDGAFKAMQAGRPDQAFQMIGSAVQKMAADGKDAAFIHQRLLEIFDGNVTAVNLIEKNYGKVSKAINVANSALDGNSSTSVEAANAVTELGASMKDTLTWQQQLYENMKDVFDIFRKFLASDVGKKLFTIMSQALDNLMKKFEENWPRIEEILTGVIDKMGPVVASILALTDVVLGAIGVEGLIALALAVTALSAPFVGVAIQIVAVTAAIAALIALADMAGEWVGKKVRSVTDFVGITVPPKTAGKASAASIGSGLGSTFARSKAAPGETGMSPGATKQFNRMTETAPVASADTAGMEAYADQARQGTTVASGGGPPIYVVLQGDAKKFFNASVTHAQNKMGAAGMTAALTR